MRSLVRVAAIVSVLVVLAVVASTITVVASVRKSFPDVEGSFRAPGLSAPVEVRRDEWGVPQIYADTAHDLFLAQGYVHAQDRFFEMDFRRHLTSGRLSEWFGESQIQTDKFIRTLGWRETAEREFPDLDPRTQNYLRAYADGVNAYLDSREGSEISVEYTMGLLGPEEEVRPWEPVDSLAWLKAMAWDLRGNLESEIERVLASANVSPERVAELYPPYPHDRHDPIVTEPRQSGKRQDEGEQRRQPGKRQDEGEQQGKREQQGGEREQGNGSSGNAREQAALPSAGVPYELPEGSREALAELDRLLADLPAALGAGVNGRTGIGSNAWAVSGEHTASGKPLLANDPHLSGQIPSIWYQMGLHCRHKSEICPYDVSGFTFSGFPGVIIGHNERIAWGFTNLGADVTDLYLELVDDNSYLYDGERHPLESRREVLLVKDSAPVEFTVRSTRHGPLLSDVSTRYADIGEQAAERETASVGGLETAIALRWTAMDAGRTADAVFMLNSAQGWKDFRAAARLFAVPAQNMVYADVDGHIGYQAPGRIPIRRGSSGEWPTPGWTSAHGWKGWIPFRELPSVLDPPEGYIVTANNAVTGPAYPHRMADRFAYGYRSDRIADRLRSAETVNVQAMAELQLDSRHGFAPVLVPHLLRVDGLNAFTRQGRATLKDWDFVQDVDSSGAAFYNAVWRNLLAMTFHDELPEGARPDGGDRWYEVVRRLLEEPRSAWWDDVRTDNVRERRDMILRQAMTKARIDLTRKLAKDPERWRWGRLHQLELTNQTFGSSGFGPLEALFNRGRYEVAGGSDAVLATSWNAAGGDFEVGVLPSMRMVVDLSDFDDSRWINLTGASGHPWADHYDDQLPLWVQGETTAWPYTRPAVERATTHSLQLTP